MSNVEIIQYNWSRLTPELQEMAKTLQLTEERFSPYSWHRLLREGRKKFNLPPVHPWTNFCVAMMKSLVTKGKNDLAIGVLADQLLGEVSDGAKK